jgi:WXG100 family type VII secretion target
MSNDTYMHVDFNGLDGVVADLQRHADAAHTAMNDLGAQLQQHLASWSSDAEGMYVQKKAGWDADFDHIHQILAGAQAHVTNTNDNYRATEQAATKSWG